MSNRLLSTEMMKDMMRARVASMLKQHEIFVKKGWCKSLEQLKAEWAARPWHERARINAMNWIRAKRIRLGEIVAGREFNDDY